MENFFIEVDHVSTFKNAIKSGYKVILIRGRSTPVVVEEIISLMNGNVYNSIFPAARILTPGNTANHSVGSSFAPHFPHTDGCYSQHERPGFVILQTIRSDRLGGGKGYFWSLKNAYKSMPKVMFDCLSSFPVRYERTREDGKTVDTYQGTIINVDDYHEEPTIRWRKDFEVWPKLDFAASASDKKLFDESIDWMSGYFKEENRTDVTYIDGDIVVTNNLQAVHGRSEIRDQNRILKRFWVNISKI